MGHKRRIWRNRNKPEAEKERRRLLNKEKKSPQLNPLRSSSSKNLTGQGRSEAKVSPEIESRWYRSLSPLMKETVDCMLAQGIPMAQVIRGLS